MDNYDSFIFDGLLDRYIEEQAKFKKRTSSLYGIYLSIS